jgi:uncharacterized membrane protein
MWFLGLRAWVACLSRTQAEDRRDVEKSLLENASTVGRSLREARPSRPPKLPAFIMGLGLGGFLDGIVMHQLLQWHHMLSATGDHPMNTVSGKEENVFADGLFHVGTWILVGSAMLLTVKAWQRRELAPPWRFHFGLLLAGWGVFNLVEGVINHQLLGIHHVRDDLGGPVSWDLTFLFSGIVLMGVGWMMVSERTGSSHED